MTNAKLPLFFKSKPLFGFDIGHGSIKLVQLDQAGKKTKLQAYGNIFFDPKAINEGEILNFDLVSRAAHNLIKEHLAGSLSTNRIAASLPVLHSFSRIVNLPTMEEKDLYEAVRMEAEQYIPIPINELYLDYQLVDKSPESNDFLVAAAPKRVVDSYVNLFNILGLELACMEPSILSVTRIVQQAEKAETPTLLIDCGSVTTDLIIFNKSSVRVTGTIKFGGETLTQSISEKLGIPISEAAELKQTHGLDPGHEQAKIVNALAESLEYLSTEIQKIIRYYEERDKSQKVKVEQIIILGGGANLPGFSTYLTSELRIPTRLANIWENIDLGHVEKPTIMDTSMYATAAGLALINPSEVIK
jgi:type IV pilus assembly protein PilM